MLEETTSKVKYLGQLRTHCVHTKSGNEVITDAPVDNHGKGESFSPTDLVATALCSCMLTLMGIKAESKAWDLGEIKADVYKFMSASPRRISKVKIVFNFSKKLDETQQKILENSARTCPVAQSLSPEVEQDIYFNWA